MPPLAITPDLDFFHGFIVEDSQRDVGSVGDVDGRKCPN